jgi:hypothetical protein
VARNELRFGLLMIEKVIACKFVTLSLTARVLKNETLTLNVKPKAMKHEAITTHFLAQNNVMLRHSQKNRKPGPSFINIPSNFCT